MSDSNKTSFSISNNKDNLLKIPTTASKKKKKKNWESSLQFHV